MAFLFAILTAFILYPVLRVLWIALSDETGNLTLIHFLNFFRRPLFREALWNTLVSGLLVVVFSGLLSLPLAYIIARYEFRGKLLLQTAATLPLVIPPFVGAGLIGHALYLGQSTMFNVARPTSLGVALELGAAPASQLPFLAGLLVSLSWWVRRSGQAARLPATAALAPNTAVAIAHRPSKIRNPMVH